MTEDFYDLLDIPPDASQDEIKDAYREQVRVYHPDLNDDDRARAQFTAVKKANDILSDPVERQAYDRLGHETYVAKRTSGLPSADVWRSSDDDDGDESDDTGSKTATASATSAGSSTTATGTGSSSSTSASSGGTGTGTASSAGTGTDRGATSGTASASSTGTAAGGTTGATAGSASSSQSRGTTGSGTGSNSTGSRTETPGSESESSTDNAVVRWWRRQNFSLPLIWLSVLVYLAGLVQFALANDGALEGLADELTAVGANPELLWETLTSSRHGVETTFEFVAGLELVAVPLEEPLWYGGLAGVVALTLITLLGARAIGDGEMWRPVSIDETIVVALAVTAATTVVGGPLLAGAVLMPMLFTVIVRHTRRGPGWQPSYLYVVPVLAPLAGLGIAAAGESTLAIDLFAFVILPLVGGLGLPLRATIRKRFGR